MQQFLTRLFNRLIKSRNWVLIILATILIKWVSLYPGWVEHNYSRGIYPVIARVQRFIFGWIPFSIGDLFYLFVLLIIFYKVFKFFRLLFRKQLNRQYFVKALQQGIFILLFLYVFFNLLWGLNYNRRGIAYQLGLAVKPYSVADLDTLTNVLQVKLNTYAGLVTEAERDSFDKKSRLFRTAVKSYYALSQSIPFLQYKQRSIKPSLFSYIGNYLGFQGYYNPFTGEGQVNTTIPRFLEPYVTTHEMAHQLGYGKENEANFVGFLACRTSGPPAFSYSAYYDVYNYALGELFLKDSTKAIQYFKNQHPQVTKDQETFRRFYARYRNPIEPIIMWGYGHFLKANNQPEGKRSYNEVVLWLIAYYKKYGLAAL